MPVIVNETVDAKKQNRVMTLTRLVHLSLLRCWLVYVSAEIDHLSQSEQSIHYRNISLKLPTTGNYDFTYVCFVLV